MKRVVEYLHRIAASSRPAHISGAKISKFNDELGRPWALVTSGTVVVAVKVGTDFKPEKSVPHANRLHVIYDAMLADTIRVVNLRGVQEWVGPYRRGKWEPCDACDEKGYQEVICTVCGHKHRHTCPTCFGHKRRPVDSLMIRQTRAVRFMDYLNLERGEYDRAVDGNLVAMVLTGLGDDLDKPTEFAAVEIRGVPKVQTMNAAVLRQDGWIAVIAPVGE